MATSGSYNFSMSRDDIIVDAFGGCGILNEGKTISGDMTARASRLLNMIVQQLSGDADGAPNMKMWTRKHATLFLQKDQAVYDLGPNSTDDYATNEDYLSTTLSANASSGASTVDLTSVSGISDGDIILILLDSGSWDQNTVNGAPSGNTVTLTNTLSGAASSGKTVYSFTNRIQKPLTIVDSTMIRRENDGDDTPMAELTIAQYQAIPDKDADGDPIAYYYEEKRINGKLYFESAVNDAEDLVKFVYLSPIEDFDAANDEAEFPKVWYRAIVYTLAIDLCMVYRIPVTNELKELKAESLGIARNEDPEKVAVWFEPGRVHEGY